MSSLLKARCSKGHLVIYDDHVSIEHSVLGNNTVPFSQITGCQVKVTAVAIPVISKGLATLKVFSKGEQVIEAKLMTVAEAKKAEEIINELISKSSDNPSNSGISDLEKLAELKEKGVITSEEFDLKKKQLLGI